MRLIAIICLGLMAAGSATAEPRETLGFGRMFNNDFFGDTQDRWRTGSYTFSILRGAGWEGDLATTPGAVLEYRLRTEIIAPAALNGAGSNDRAYVGALSAGLHRHFAAHGAEISTGVDLVAVGPQTGLGNLQEWFHNLIGLPSLSNRVTDAQVSNAVYPTALGALVYPVRISEDITFRPFIEAQYGVEDILRVGADVTIGSMLNNSLWLRDVTTGQLYSGIENEQSGAAFVVGADYAMVGDSAYFPASFGTVAQEERFRARAGVHWRIGAGISYFYGITYLSEEYVGQPEGQILGSLRLNFNF